ncbi:MAG: transglutaminase family protein [Proteobacteria bacterium]|nr:transglutaminase family protein [Pseudomonadota bacterium]
MDGVGTDWAEAKLRGIAAAPAERLDLGEAALALASLERRQVGIERYRDHLVRLGEDVGACAGAAADTLAARTAALNAAILGKHGYRGDAENYDDLQNANLMRVIDRRRGLPVTLGILYIHAARAQGWDMVGLSFPGHFLVRLEAADGRAIIDPFNGGKTPDAGALRELLRATAGAEAELAPEHYETVPDRAVLLRLQNNIKLRLIGADRIAKAAEVVEVMLLFAPDQADLWREAGLLHAHLGNLGAAGAAIEHFLALADNDTARHTMATLLQRVRAKLN